MRRRLRHRCVHGLILSVLLLITATPGVADDYLDQDLNGDDEPYEVLMHHLGVRISGRIYLDGLARDVLQRGWNSTLYPYIEVGGGVFYAKYRSGRQREYVRALLKFPLNTLIGIDLTYHNGAKGEVLDHEESLILSLDVRI